ncbi:MAG: stage II sporulation protein P [Lachnospiraceae bacterium]|nr:stage II sporulation protein P [Lachnospiraceae bacterium]
MRLIVQGLRTKGKKKTLEMLELMLIVCLLIGIIGFYELGKEKEESKISIQQLFKENAEMCVIRAFFPVLTMDSSDTYANGAEFFLNKLISYPMPLYSYMEKYNDVTGFDNNTEEKLPEKEREAYIIADVPEDMLELLNRENGFSDTGKTVFIKNTEKVTNINLASYETIEDFIKAFYTVDSVTAAVPELFETEVLSGMDMTIKQKNDKPQILIYHTHSQEGFLDSVPGDSDTTIVGAGELLKNVLTNEYGYNVIHHTGEYDVPSRDYAYSKSLPALEQLLAENPSIEVVIDLHRDGVAETTHLVTDLNGIKTAKVMFFNGLSYTKKNGPIGYLENRNLQENLAFSFQMQMAANEYYPGLMRKNYLNGYRYNMHLRGKSLLIELVAQTNTVEEIKNAIGPLAHILDIVLSGGNT